jgi:tetratricopeptide (TPR) repeat protein
MRVVLLLFALLAGLAPAQELNPDQLLKQAIDAQQRGDFEAAIQDYRKVLELRPNTVEAKVNLGAALVRVGRFDEAIAMYRSALPSVSQKNSVLMNIALAYYKKGDFENAREQLETVHKAQPNDVRSAILLGDTYLRLGKFDAAVALLEPLEAKNSQNLDFEYVLGSALIQSGRRRDGVSRIEQVAESGNSADAYMLAGMTLSQMNEFEKARHDLDAALRLNPKLPGIYTLAGIARDKNGDVKEAESAFREALKINPDDFDANLYLGAILLKRREMDEAKPYLDRALRLNPINSMVRYEAAMFKSTSGQYEAAAQDLEKLVADDPNWLDPHVQLASLYYRLHRPEDGAKERKIVDRLTAEQQAKGPGK